MYRDTFLVLITLVRQKTKFSQLSINSEMTGQLINGFWVDWSTHKRCWVDRNNNVAELNTDNMKRYLL